MWNNATPEVVNQYGVVRAKNAQQAARGVGQLNVAPLANIDKMRGRPQNRMPGHPRGDNRNPRLQAALMALLPPKL
jgi:hypothetical protein